MTTWWHEERLSAVVDRLSDTAPASIADLGCGSGDLLLRLADLPGLTRLVGLESRRALLERAVRRLDAARVELVHGSILDAGRALTGLDAAALVEVIEHLDPAALPALARAVFGEMRPRRVVLTTPNAEFNPLLGVPPKRFRHPDHRFEWTRAQFGDWAGSTALAHGYDVSLHPVAGRHPELGGASQMAVFDRTG